MSMIRAFVFDLDGTLVETEELKALSYARAAVELCPDLVEADVVEAFKDFVGRSRQEVATGLVRRFGLQEAARGNPGHAKVGARRMPRNATLQTGDSRLCHAPVVAWRRTMIHTAETIGRWFRGGRIEERSTECRTNATAAKQVS
jgi:phosphoglycolate phosphatase-like HAD superfamily hydrolase